MSHALLELRQITVSFDGFWPFAISISPCSLVSCGL